MITEFTLYQRITIKLLFKKTLQLNYSKTKITKRVACHMFLQCIKYEICCFILHSTHFKFQNIFPFLSAKLHISLFYSLVLRSEHIYLEPKIEPNRKTNFGSDLSSINYTSGLYIFRTKKTRNGIESDREQKFL